MNTARYVLGGGGSQTAAIAFGGARTPGPASQAVTELYDGTSWTEVNDLNTGRDRLAGSGANAGAILAFGGEASPGYVANTEDWNGNNWTEVSDLNTAAIQLSGSGTTTSTISNLGQAPSVGALAEEWSGSSTTTKVLTD